MSVCFREMFAAEAAVATSTPTGASTENGPSKQVHSFD
jgi:hypothetical protein